MGLPKTKKPVIEAEITKNKIIKSGAKKLSGLLLSKMFSILERNNDTAKT